MSGRPIPRTIARMVESNPSSLSAPPSFAYPVLGTDISHPASAQKQPRNVSNRNQQPKNPSPYEEHDGNTVSKVVMGQRLSTRRAGLVHLHPTPHWAVALTRSIGPDAKTSA